METSIAARRLLTPDGGLIDHPFIRIDDGIITAIETHAAPPHATHAFPEATLVPAFLDIHIHGCAGHDVMEATPVALATIGTFLARRGVAAYLPTTVTSTREATLRSLAGLASEIRRLEQSSATGAIPLGIHLEGPFLSHSKRGVHPAALLEPPSLALFDQFWQAAEGRILLMTVAPELPGAPELIAHATALGVRCSLGHSNARVPEAQAGLAAGARSATHTFNAMRALDHRDPGLAAFVLDEPSLFAELICDGIHVDALMVRLFTNAKGLEKIILVTDGISATGMPDGTYLLGNLEVQVHDGRCTSAGALAGSVLTLERAVRNLIAFTGVPLATAAHAASRNPARLIGHDDRGTLEAGGPATLTVLSDTAEVLQTFIAGRPFAP